MENRKLKKDIKEEIKVYDGTKKKQYTFINYTFSLIDRHTDKNLHRLDDY